MISATVSSKYQISIPKRLREILHIKVGQQFVFIVHGQTIQLVPKRSLNEVKGILSGVNTANIRDRKDRNE